MKRGLTLLMLSIFLLNVLGYYGVFVGLQFKNKREMQARFDKEDYSPAQEVTIKVPLTVPYATDSREYTRVDGEFEHQGDTYRMVKQKLQRDTLYIVCVKDNASQNIKQALTDYVKTFTDKPVGEKSNSKTAQNLIKDYIVSSTTLQSVSDGWFKVLTPGTLVAEYTTICNQLVGPPPKS